jgi:hypothetical protein
MDLEALALAVRDLEGEGVRKPESQALDGGEGDLMVQRGGRRAETPHLLHTEDGGEPVGGVSPNQRQRVPIALQAMLREEAEATGAEAHGRWGEAIDVLTVQAGVLECRCGDHVGRCAIELSQQADLTDVGLVGALSLATEWQRGHHVLTQWGHEISPCLR